MKKLKRWILYITFGIYCVVIVIILFGCNRSYYWSGLSICDYIYYNTNIIPFKTLYIYITALVKHTINVDTLIRNLLGNIVLFIPMGWYVPVIYKKQYSFKDAVWKMCGVIIFTELIQLISMRGTYDIDDIILRVTGFCIGTVLWESKVGKKMSILVNGCGE
jgi:glycopeptide antibiotics resistance protein